MVIFLSRTSFKFIYIVSVPYLYVVLYTLIVLNLNDFHFAYVPLPKYINALQLSVIQLRTVCIFIDITCTVIKLRLTLITDEVTSKTFAIQIYYERFILLREQFNHAQCIYSTSVL